MVTTAKTRKSGIELLRIVSILMVITLHFFGTIGFDIVGGSITNGTPNYYIASTFDAFSIIGVNCFVLIAGYFSITSNTIKIRKIVDILLTVAFLGGGLYIVSVLTGYNSFSIKELINCACPYIKGGLWFIRVYLVLIIISPFINIGLNHLTKKSYQKLIVLLLLIFSVWPSFFPNPIDDTKGLGIISFVVLYIIGGYLRVHYQREISKYWYLAGYIVCSLIILLTSLLRPVQTFYNYDFIFTIASSVCLFMFFAKMKFQSKVVNCISKSVLTIYIAHNGMCFMQLLYFDLFNIKSSANTTQLIPKYLMMLAFQFTVPLILYGIKSCIFIPVNKLLDKIKIINKKIEI